MVGITFGLADFRTGGPILDLPVMPGSSWSAQLNRADSLTARIDMRDPDTVALDLRSSSEPMKTVLLARTDDDVIIAWGLIPDDGRIWDEDSKTLTLVGTGITGSWLEHCIVAPASARTAKLIVPDAEGYPTVNPALDTYYSGISHGTMMKRLLQARLAWPGAPTVFDLPPDEAVDREQSYSFASLKSIGAAFDDLVKQENGPDFAFDAQRASDGVSLRYVMRVGTEAKPRIGTDVGVWALGEGSPISGLKVIDAIAAGASAGWMIAGKQSGDVLVSRVLNSTPIANGYPPFDVVDTTHNDVRLQATLDGYNRQNMSDAQAAIRDLSFTVRGDAHPSLGQYRPGDTIKIDVPEGHPWHTGSIPIRITSISGDETGDEIKIGCVVLDA